MSLSAMGWGSCGWVIVVGFCGLALQGVGGFAGGFGGLVGVGFGDGELVEAGFGGELGLGFEDALAGGGDAGEGLDGAVEIG
ncbi:MAG: hypothetical protein AB8F26_08785 [Phycisphaerales bacterium]